MYNICEKRSRIRLRLVCRRHRFIYNFSHNFDVMPVIYGFKKKIANSTLSDKFSIFRSSIGRGALHLFVRGLEPLIP